MNRRPIENDTPASIEDRASESSRYVIWSVLAIAISLGWTWFQIHQGWTPHDEGQLGQSAERVLQGQLPHRDFDEMYTSGLSFLNALSFRLWGINSDSMRWMLFAWFVPFLVGVAWLASQFAKPIVTALVTVLAALWSIPIYAAAMPSWYNLFFATWALCGLIAFAKTGTRSYLLLAGLAIGVSIVFKISGVFVLAAALLFLLYRNQLHGTVFSGSSRRLSMAVSVALLLATGLCLVFVNSHDPIMQTIHFVIPFAALTLFVLQHEWTATKNEIAATDSISTRLRSIFADTSVLILGASVPVLLLVAYYLKHDAISDLTHGALVLPKQRMDFACAAFPSWQSMLFCLPLFVVLYPYLRTFFAKESELEATQNEANGKSLFPFIVVVLAFLLVVCWTKIGFAISFYGFRNLIPLVVLANLAMLHAGRDRLSVLRRQQLFAITAVGFFVSLIQFPFAVAIYFFYAAPLMVLATLAGTSLQRGVSEKIQIAILLFFILFSLLRFHSAFPNDCTQEDFQATAVRQLKTDRCQLRVPANVAKVYDRLQVLVDEHTSNDQPIFATPDAPEISYLTNRESFNGVMYEFFHDGLYQDVGQLLNELRTRNVEMVVINERPNFSALVTDELRSGLLEDFALQETVNLEQPSGISVPAFSVYLRVQY